MSKQFLVDINLNKNELQNGVVQNLASDPNNPIAGQIYFNTTTNRFRVYTGSEWDEMGTGGGTVTSVSVSNDTDGGLSVSGSPITTTGTISIGHSNVLANTQTTSGIYPIKIDKNGHISEYGSAVDLSLYAPKASPELTGTPTAPTATSGDNSTQIATTAFVAGAISSLEGAMHYKGTIDTTSGLPSTNVSNGDTYKVAEDGTYNSQVAKVGDLFIAVVDNSTITWTYIPSADETAVTSVTAGTGLTGGTITTTGTIALDTSGVTAGTYQGLTIDSYGRVTSASNMGYSTLSKYTSTIEGDGTTTSFTITHNLNNRNIVINVYNASTYEDVIVDTVRTTANAITVTFGNAPSSGTDYNVVIIG